MSDVGLTLFQVLALVKGAAKLAETLLQSGRMSATDEEVNALWDDVECFHDELQNTP
jgi:hypothetical protein